MTTQPDLPVLDAVMVEEMRLLAKENLEFPYFIHAYWPSGKRWRLHPETYSRPDSPELLRQAQRLTEKGWTFIRIIKVPELE